MRNAASLLIRSLVWACVCGCVSSE